MSVLRQSFHVVMALVVLTACGRAPERVLPLAIQTAWPMPDVEERAPCADVGDLRACWSASDAAGVHIVTRRTPPFALSSLGFRIIGTGKTARAVDRGRAAPEFVCDGDVCRQAHPRLPDDGEWECADFAAIVVCHGGAAPAGVPPGASDAGYVCGPRHSRDGKAERVCVDLSPDTPKGIARGERCRFDAENGLVRDCRKDGTAQSVTDPCRTATDCASGLVCASGRCLPPLPAPSCWADNDCDKSSCRFGSCVGDPT
ncbi:MAG TPA: hypothetical protein VH062_05745 [Polyangiaceae bacterium]|nr:hypothetical protein [Polyangiaceae bacterium]